MKQTLITIFIFICINAFSNDTISYFNNISFSFSTMHFQDGAVRLNDIMSLELEYNHNFSEIISFGGFFGLGIFDEWYKEDNSSSSSYTFTQYRYSTHYGLNGKVHILPIQVGFIPQRFDLYLTGNFGLVSLLSTQETNITPERGTYVNASIMGGGSFYFLKKLGFFVEAGYGKSKYINGFCANYGLTFRF